LSPALVSRTHSGGYAIAAEHAAELRRDMARLRFVMDQITEIEQARLNRIAQDPEKAKGEVFSL
jgi:hypothetical protein